MTQPIQSRVQLILRQTLAELETHFNADVFTYCGPIVDGNEAVLLKLFEDLAAGEDKRPNLVVLLTTGGGSAVAVERYVNIIRHHYNEVSFVVPDYAYSAGTVWCMSGDHILMDYFSVLGPIDPQVQNRDGNLVPALGYLDKVEELLDKARSNTLTQPEFLMLKELDLAELRSYEQAKELTIALLKRWLVRYKFKNWETHQTNPKKKGQPVTLEEKEQRAEEIADALNDNKRWKSHGRPINLATLRDDLRLKIEDFSADAARTQLIRTYYGLITDYIYRNDIQIFVQTRHYI